MTRVYFYKTWQKDIYMTIILHITHMNNINKTSMRYEYMTQICLNGWAMIGSILKQLPMVSMRNCTPMQQSSLLVRCLLSMVRYCSWMWQMAGSRGSWKITSCSSRTNTEGSPRMGWEQDSIRVSSFLFTMSGNGENFKISSILTPSILPGCS